MQLNPNFVPHHINATAIDLEGNNGIGRYVILPGSDGRAKEIAEHFNNLRVNIHPRGHNLYLGTLECNGHTIEVATISSGMGCPSMEIILHELFQLGAKRFLRAGTAGSLQPDFLKLGDIIQAQGSVRDESTSIHHAPIEIPAISSYEFTQPIMDAALKLGLSKLIHSGIVHCKSSFYAREFGVGPQAVENQRYIDLLTQCGILATEMETSTLFIQSQLYNQQLRFLGIGPQYRIITSAILAIIAVPPHAFATGDQASSTINNLVQLAIESVKTLALSELNIPSYRAEQFLVHADDKIEPSLTS